MKSDTHGILSLNLSSTCRLYIVGAGWKCHQILVKGWRNQKEDWGMHLSLIRSLSRMSVVEHALFRALPRSSIYEVEEAAAVV